MRSAVPRKILVAFLRFLIKKGRHKNMFTGRAQDTVGLRPEDEDEDEECAT